MKSTALIYCLLATTTAMAAEDPSSTSQSTHAEKRTYIGNEMVGIKPAIGFVNYTDSQDSTSTRMSYGINIEYNWAAAFGMDFTRWYVGPQTGVTFSHLGNPTSTAFGFDPDTNSGEGGANLLLIPANLKLAIAPKGWIRIGAHGGGTVTYRSLVQSVTLGDSTDNWRFLPNVGADLDLAFSRNAALSFRPDWILSGGDSMFSAAVALGVTL